MLTSLLSSRYGDARVASEAVRQRGAAWQAVHARQPVAPEAIVTFAIPLMGRDRASDWGRVTTNLRATLRSLEAQTSSRWRALICSQDQPEVPLSNRIAFLRYPEPLAAGKMSDQAAKIEYLVDHLTARPGGDGWIFCLDADDLVHPGLVAHVLQQNDPAGYVLTRGFILDAATGAMGYHGENKFRYPRAVPFCKYCGSSSLIRMDLRRPEAARSMLRDRGGHGVVMHHMAAYGMQPRRIPFGAAIYLVNHGDNMRLKRGKQDRKLSYVEKNRLTRRARDAVAAEFALQRLLDTTNTARLTCS